MCNFPAAALLRMRRQVAADADKTNDPQFINNAARFCKGIDDARLYHEELTGCNCWYEAVNAV